MLWAVILRHPLFEGRNVAHRKSPLGSRSATVRMLLALSLWVLVPAIGLGNAGTWKTAASGTWGLNSSWTDGSVPGNNDSATFNLAGTYTATFDTAPAAIQDLFVTGSGTNARFQSTN